MAQPAIACVRLRTPADLERCVTVLRQVHQLDHYPARWPADPVAFLTPADELVSWVAESDAEVVGHVMLAEIPPELAALTSVEGRPEEQLVLLRQLFVSPGVRGHRLGARLLELAAAEAAARQRRPVLQVLSLNLDAIALYGRAGWSFIATTKPTWAPPGTHALVFLAPLTHPPHTDPPHEDPMRD